jgi:hypothetical protein
MVILEKLYNRGVQQMLTLDEAGSRGRAVINNDNSILSENSEH